MKKINGLKINAGACRRRGWKKGWSLQQRIKFYVQPVESGCWEWTGVLDSHGYGKISIYIGPGTVSRRASRVAYEAFKGQVPDGLFVLHTCDNRLCCNPQHLYVGDHKQNMKDARERGRFRNKRISLPPTLQE